ncbi:MAG TPA: C25 family cysteine peptidase, partial [Candidatus Edwardsbacteria bacterium]|nr:C25 family cysteine peptidase [Candidatus Edwardsbacteria bacterium]
KQWRTMQGIKTGCYTTDSTGTTSAAIKAWIKNAYNTWAIPPVAVLLIGDWPGQGFSIPADIVSDSYSGDYFPCDNRYSDPNGDSLPDINVARIEAGTAADFPNTIGKMMKYERNPYTTSSFYNNPISVVGYQSDRWFQLSGEVCYGFWKNHQGRNASRLYYSSSPPAAGSPWSTQTTYGNTPLVTHYWKGYGYIDSLIPASVTWTTTAAQISAAINNGLFMVLHRDHGDTTAWADPAYTNTNALALTDTLIPFLYTINCLTGRYATGSTEFPGPSQCLGEAFYKQSHGVLGYIAPSDVSFSFDNDAMIWGMFDCLWPDFDPGYSNASHFGDKNMMPGFSMAFGKWYLKAHMTPWTILGSDSLSGAYVTYQLFHMHGDAFLTIYDQVPQDLTVSHAATLIAGATSFAVTANAGALISLTVNGQIIGTGTGTGSALSITIPAQTPGQTMVVTVTKPDYRRYTGTVAIIAASGPYVSHLKHTMTDAGGNNDGIANPGETVRLPTWVINNGVAAASGVVGTLRCISPYGSVTADSSYTYGTIAANDSSYYAAGFGLYINPADSNGAVIPLSLVCKDSKDSTWTSSISVTVGTAVLGFNGRTINGNGRLDPNKVSKMAVGLANNGIGYGYSTQAVLRCSNGLVNITDSTAAYGTINPGASGTSGADSFTVSCGAVPVGTTVTFTIVMKASGTADRSYSWTETVGDIKYSATPDNNSTPLYYAVEDSDGVDRAPVYSWYEIRSLGTRLTGGDDSTKSVTIPFTFRWYGTGYTTASVCTNGWLSLGSNASTAYTNTAIPTTTFATPTIFAYWNDLNAVSGTGWVGYYYDASNKRFVVEWDSVVDYGSTTYHKFEVMLYDSTGTGTKASKYYDAVVQYKLLTPGSSSSIGFQNSSTIGAQELQDGTYAATMLALGPNRAVRLTGKPSSTLAVSMSSFGAQLGEQGIVVRWRTESELDCYRWEVERSTQPGGGFQAVAGLDGHGTTSQPNEYAWVDGSRLADGTYWYRISEIDMAGHRTAFGPVAVPVSGRALPLAYELQQSRPNPSRGGRATISFALRQDGATSLRVYNVLGQTVRTLADGELKAGYYQRTWDGLDDRGRAVAGGVYFYQLRSGGFSDIRKMTVLR